MAAERRGSPTPKPQPLMMDVDFLDLDALSSWAFDTQSPLWLFEDRADVWSSVPCNSEIVNEYTDKDDGKKQKFQMVTVDNSSDGSCLIRERMAQALRYLKESTDQHVLAQVWAPIKSGDKYVLTTSGQPFILDPRSLGLHHYRTVSVMYVFSVDEDCAGDLGLPGRVFRRKLPEWTPNVQYYSSKEYPRLSHAVSYNVQGTLALPVFEPSAQSCVGVLELILTSQKINYAPEVDKVCKALEAVNLKSYEILDHPSVQICNEGRQAALAEILEILTMVCEVHKLPLAQTWVPCKHRCVLAHGGGYKKSCSSFDGSCMGQVCMSTTDAAFYVIDAHVWGFRDACVEHHLQEGQGVAGRAFTSRSSCFSRDITQFCKTEYPLVHYARIFGLAGCYAICLQSIYTGNDDYILEFFLPSDCKDPGEQQALLDSISSVIKQYFRSLKVIDNANLLDGGTLKVTANEDQELEHKDTSAQRCKVHSHTKSPERKPPERVRHPQNEENEVSDVLPELHLLTDVNVEKNGDLLDRDSSGRTSASLFVNLTDVNVEKNGDLLDRDSSGRTSATLFVNSSERKLQRKRGKAEKSISLEVLQQYFSGSLKDAAKSLGVCPTTMKRICRQHGISRWPSRKINKVNRSLTTLKRVIESVQGAEGAFNLLSLTCPLPMAIGTVSWATNLEACKQTIGSKPLNTHGQANKDLSPHKTPEDDDRFNNLKAQKATSSHLDHGNDSHVSESRSSSGEGSMDTPIFQESSEGSPVNPVASFNLGEGFDFIDFSRLNMSMPEANEAKPPTRLSDMLMEDSGSSKDLRNLFNSSVEGCHDEQLITPTHGNPSKLHDTEIVTIKASYKEDIIRFRLPCVAGVVALTDEVAKRLKLEVGTFDIKYLDDDQEWVMLACDADLEECIEISLMSGAHTVRLLIHDIVSCIGSSCGSSE